MILSCGMSYATSNLCHVQTMSRRYIACSCFVLLSTVQMIVAMDPSWEDTGVWSLRQPGRAPHLDVKILLAVQPLLSIPDMSVSSDTNMPTEHCHATYWIADRKRHMQS